jgi:hypothetical protein
VISAKEEVYASPFLPLLPHKPQVLCRIVTDQESLLSQLGISLGTCNLIWHMNHK